jgi:hypothetical protein
VIDGPIRAATAATLANFAANFIAQLAPHSLEIRDPPGNFQVTGDVMPQLLALTNASKIASIDFRNGGVPIAPSRRPIGRLTRRCSTS